MWLIYLELVYFPTLWLGLATQFDLEPGTIMDTSVANSNQNWSNHNEFSTSAQAIFFPVEHRQNPASHTFETYYICVFSNCNNVPFNLFLDSSSG